MRTALRFHPLPPITRPILVATALALVVLAFQGGLFPDALPSARGDTSDPLRATALVLLGMGMAAVATLVARLAGRIWMRILAPPPASAAPPPTEPGAAAWLP
jgi:hypothetical protein